MCWTQCYAVHYLTCGLQAMYTELGTNQTNDDSHSASGKTCALRCVATSNTPHPTVLPTAGPTAAPVATLMQALQKAIAIATISKKEPIWHWYE